MDLRVIGVYPVSAPEPTHLVEIVVARCTRTFDVGVITQEATGTPRENWQVPWDEHFLDAAGSSALDVQPAESPRLPDFRVVFFFHYLDFAKPLVTPAGPIELPQPEPRPARLAFLEYEAPH